MCCTKANGYAALDGYLNGMGLSDNSIAQNVKHFYLVTSRSHFFGKCEVQY